MPSFIRNFLSRNRQRTKYKYTTTWHTHLPSFLNRKNMTYHQKIPPIFTTILILTSSSIARYIITPTTPLLDNETLISSSGFFALGFFNPNPNNYYIGLWYKQIPEKTVVWVANRANPLVNSPGVLSITLNGTLTITQKDSRVVWSSNTSTILTNPIAQLLDNGNLVVKESNDDDASKYAWQGFDHITDTLLADMKVGVDSTTGLNHTLTSWSSPTDPTPGPFHIYLETQGNPEFFLANGTNRIWRTGPYDGTQFSGVPIMWTNEYFNFSFVNNKSEGTYSYHLDPSIISRLFVTSFGSYQRAIWLKDKQKWDYYWSEPKETCDHIGMCGNYGLCDVGNTLACECLMGFEPKNSFNWNTLMDGRDGCVRKHELDCVTGTDGFVVVKNVKLPQSEDCVVDLSLSLDECRSSCLKNCSCTAYTSAIAGNSSGCVIWIGRLFDMRNYNSMYGQDLYVRLNAIDIPKAKATLGAMNSYSNEQRSDSIDLPIFNFDTITAATNSFSSDNKLGEGGFGPVYKGKIGDDQEVAVKRLSKTSSQGSEEFKNEVTLIAKLQHRNLVRLLGCCIQGEERMLIYEYLPNNSLDAFLFEEEQRSLLDWDTRYQIITGIARGLLYLHHDSRLRIIHRDLKAGNILLDKEMIPKISDFGMARIFSGNETDFNTRKIVGTYGYMSPEYAMYGAFSVKSDVFSFGVLVLEIISGKKNRVYAEPPHIKLLSHAWSLWKEGKGIQLVDDSMSDSFLIDEVLRCMNIGLLCVQEHPEDRPLMSSVVQMFSSDVQTIPQPKQPGFASVSHHPEPDSLSNQESCSNELSITMLNPR